MDDPDDAALMAPAESTGSNVITGTNEVVCRSRSRQVWDDHGGRPRQEPCEVSALKRDRDSELLAPRMGRVPRTCTDPEDSDVARGHSRPDDGSGAIPHEEAAERRRRVKRQRKTELSASMATTITPPDVCNDDADSFCSSLSSQFLASTDSEMQSVSSTSSFRYRHEQCTRGLHSLGLCGAASLIRNSGASGVLCFCRSSTSSETSDSSSDEEIDLQTTLCCALTVVATYLRLSTTFMCN
jgi:hypothetical protein